MRRRVKNREIGNGARGRGNIGEKRVYQSIALLIVPICGIHSVVPTSTNLSNASGRGSK